MSDLTYLFNKPNFYKSNILKIDYSIVQLKDYYHWFAGEKALIKMKIPICKNLFFFNHKNPKFI